MPLSHLYLPGRRRITEAMLRAQAALPAHGLVAVTRWQAIDALKAAAPALRIKPRLVELIDYLARCTRPHDWAAGLLMAWPSNGAIQDALQIGVSQLRALIRQAAVAGLLVMRDGANGQRFGRRASAAPDAPITIAFGFDLSPLRARCEEFRRAAISHAAQRREAARLFRRITAARNEVLQLAAVGMERNLPGADWSAAVREAEGLYRSRGRSRQLEILLPIATRLEVLLSAVSSAVLLSVSTPMGPENRTHTTTKSQISPKTTVAAQGRRVAPPGVTLRASGEQETATRGFKISPDLVVRLAPAFKHALELHGRTDRPGWPALYDAAEAVRGGLGISQHAWGTACEALGRQAAVVSLAVVAAKHAEGVIQAPGGYMRALVRRHLGGELRLDRTLYGLCSRLEQGVAPGGAWPAETPLRCLRSGGALSDQEQADG